ncbi:MAG: PEP-utilizing enzyme [Acidimicrobiia bacterium]|nr:PEP-utilizing enzyme [Acidimicrobiia bacterium]
MLLDLDDEVAQDPGHTGGKAAWLARGRRAGLAVLPGFVVPAEASRDAMRRGTEAMGRRGPGGALLTVSSVAMDVDLESAIMDAARALGDPLVVRSSSVLEAGGEWAGAFTSYLDIHPEEAPKAIRGCWASAFTVHTLDRYAAADLAPGSIPMAVLIQPALAPDFGGVARLVDGEVTVTGVAGSPAPLVQGWDPGAHGRVSASGIVTGESAIDLMGPDLIGAVSAALRTAYELIGANSCEWAAVDGEVTLLQLMQVEERPSLVVEIPAAFEDPAMIDLARLVRRFPGPLGEELVLPWAVAAPGYFLAPVEPLDLDPLEALLEAIEQSRALVSSAWRTTKAKGSDRASSLVRGLRGDETERALSAFAGLRVPDLDQSQAVLRLLETACRGLVAAGAVADPQLAWHLRLVEAIAILREGRAPVLKSRIGFDRWEPFDAAAVIAHGELGVGVAAAPGTAVGRMCFVSDPHDVPHFRPRDVVVGTHPLPNLAALLWDASAVITTGGGPAAHLFESARALGIPAVTGLDLEALLGGDPAQKSGQVSLAVDGVGGRAWATAW